MKILSLKRILLIALCFTVLLGEMFMVGCSNGTDNAGNNANNTNKLSAVISTQKLVADEPVTLETSPVYENQEVEVSAPLNILEEKTTGYSGEKLTITRDENYGGGQFIEKLFTEALSRAATGEEFSTFQQYIVEKGCNVNTLKMLGKAVFTSEAFKSFNLLRLEKAFCLYRAILSRDPSQAEATEVTSENFLDIMETLFDSEEFAGLLEDICFGPYYWNSNNSELYTFGSVITTSEFRKMISDASSTKVVELPQGSLVLVDSTISIPSGYTIRTEGNPDHYVKFARFLRINNQTSIQMLQLSSNSCLQNIFCDGNRSDAGKDLGWNICCSGSDNVIWGCRLSDSSSNSPLHVNPGTMHIYIGRNLITQYATNHGNNGWADGIDLYASDSIVEYNNIVDATDGGLVLFRSVTSASGTARQNSIARYNLICNVGNSAYAGIDHEGVDMNGGVSDFGGALVYGNALYTSYTAHMHMCITLSSRPWTTDFNKVANNSVINNYTPKGCFVNTAGGIVVEGTNNATVRGNQLNLNIGDWVFTMPGKRYYSVNSETCEGGDFQSGYLDLGATSFIYAGMDIEKDKTFEVKIAYVYEDFQTIPANKFFWISK